MIIDPVLVTNSVNKKIAEYEQARVQAKADTIKSLAAYEKTPQYFSKKPNGDYIDPMYDSWIDRERNHYSTVRVVENKRGFYLVYGPTDGVPFNGFEGTGSFKTFQEASDWFTSGGR